MTTRAGSVAAALETILTSLRSTSTENVRLEDALGRTLASNITAEVDLPLWDNASMDGYACQAEDIVGASEEQPVRLPVAETIGAGAFPSLELGRGKATRIMTGAPLPNGADSVVRLEDTDGGTDVVLIHNPRDAGSNIRRRGEDVNAGDVVLRAGTTLRSAEVGMLAALGTAYLAVHRRPRIAILSSGDELVPLEEANHLRAGRRIISSNTYSLAALVREAGGEPLDLGIVPDQLEAVCDALKRTFDCDLIVTSGGISVGGFDFTRAAVESLAGEIFFWRVPMRPGYNSAFGLIHGRAWLGVPGNPVSALIAGEVLLRPAIRRLAGSHSPFRALHRVVAGERLSGARGVTTFLRAMLEPGDDLPRARLAGAQGSAILSTSTRADALLIIPPLPSSVEPGERVDAIILRDEIPDPGARERRQSE